VSDRIYIPPTPNKSILDKGMDYGIKGGLLVGGFFLLRKLYRDFRKTQEEKNIDKKPETRQAMSIRSALNPSGISWMKSLDTTNTSALFQTAGEITNIEEVRMSYRSLYNDDLWDDLRSELSPTEFERFTKTVQFNQAKKTGSPVSIAQSKVLKAGWVITEKEVTIRRTPLVIGTATHFSKRDLLPLVVLYDIYKWTEDKFKGTNILAKAPANSYLGYYRGTNDDQGYDKTNDVHFIRVQSLTPDKKMVYYWVARSNVMTVQTAKEADTHRKFYIESKAFSGLSGTGNLIVAKFNVSVLNGNFRVVGKAKPEMVIGVSLYEKLSDTKGNSFLKVRTAQGYDRWVDEKLITIV
jgi:hypothetical protein